MKNDLRTIYHSHGMIARVNNKKVQNIFRKFSQSTPQHQQLSVPKGFDAAFLSFPPKPPTLTATWQVNLADILQESQKHALLFDGMRWDSVKKFC
jgi:hypothetical protein